MGCLLIVLLLVFGIWLPWWAWVLLVLLALCER